MTPRSSRRGFVHGSALAALGLVLSPASSFASEPAATAPVLVCVFLRGAADGLNIVVPHADADYYKLRPSIAVPRPGEKRGAIDLDGRFGLHPRLAGLKAAYDAGHLALLHAVGSPHPTRSHFEAQDYMETGAVGDRSAQRGWLSRYLALRSAASPEAVRAVAVTARSPLSLRGFNEAVITDNVRRFGLTTKRELRPAVTRGFRRLYADAGPGLAEHAGRHALSATELVARALGVRPGAVPGYARDVQDFADVATLIKGNIGLEVAWIDFPGWDTHKNQGSVESGDLPRRLDQLGRALSAFRTDLGPDWERVVVVVMSEFGRTARQNGTGGTDHGHGGAMLVLGGKVKGGRVLGDFPGLAPDQLHQGRDVQVTTDFRDVLGELCERHLALPDASALFPGYRLEAAKRPGVLI